MVFNRDLGDENNWQDEMTGADWMPEPQLLQEALPHKIDPPSIDRKRLDFARYLVQRGAISE